MNMARREEDDSYRELMRKIGELRKDPKKWEEYIASRADVVLDNWPVRTMKKSKDSAKSS